MFSYLLTKQLNLRVQEFPRNKCAISSAPYSKLLCTLEWQPIASHYLSPFLFLSPDLLPKQLYLRVKGQSLGISGVHHRGIRLKDDALSRGLQSCPTHGHQQIHHLRRKERKGTKRFHRAGSCTVSSIGLPSGGTQYFSFQKQIWGTDWELWISRCELLSIKWINNKVLLYSTRNYTQYPVINHNGKEYEKECTYITESFCCVAEINAI